VKSFNKRVVQKYRRRIQQFSELCEKFLALKLTILNISVLFDFAVRLQDIVVGLIVNDVVTVVNALA